MQSTSLLFKAFPVPNPPLNNSRCANLRHGSLVRRLKPMTCDPAVERRVDEFELPELERKARGDVVEVEVVGAEVVRENASAHS
jgi:hypothetical protein